MSDGITFSKNAGARIIDATRQVEKWAADGSGEGTPKQGNKNRLAPFIVKKNGTTYDIYGQGDTSYTTVLVSGVAWLGSGDLTDGQMVACYWDSAGHLQIYIGGGFDPGTGNIYDVYQITGTSGTRAFGPVKAQL